MIPVFLLNVLLPTEAALSAPVTTPLFLKLGFSSVLEFEARPTRVVIGDGGSFQVDRLEKSLVIRPSVEEATTNLVVYFESTPPRMFVLKASMEDEPALYRKFLAEKAAPAVKPPAVELGSVNGSRIISSRFDRKKDYLIIEAQIAAPKGGKATPDWRAVRLKARNKKFAPSKLWAERAEVQADTVVKARFIFNRPDVERSLRGVTLALPYKGGGKPLVFNLGGGQ
jgi:hypothetical protein